MNHFDNLITMSATPRIENSLGDARSILQRTCPKLIVTQQRLRQMDGIALVRERREAGKQNMGVRFATVRSMRASG